MNKKRYFTSAKKMADAWEEYKNYCDNQTVKKTEFSQRAAAFVTETIPAPITYTVLGFCLYNGMTDQNFYATYDKDPKFETVIARIRKECETDCRRKFENGTLPTQLSGLWMSNYGYTTKQEEKIDADMKLDINIDYGEEEEPETNTAGF